MFNTDVTDDEPFGFGPIISVPLRSENEAQIQVANNSVKYTSTENNNNDGENKYV